MTLDAEWEDLLDSIDEYLDDHEDVVDGDYGEPRPNKAMSLRSRLTEMRARAAGRAALAAQTPPEPQHEWEFYMNGSFCKRCGAAIGSGVPCR